MVLVVVLGSKIWVRVQGLVLDQWGLLRFQRSGVSHGLVADAFAHVRRNLHVFDCWV